MITFKHSGNFNNTEKLFNKISSMDYNILEKYAQEGVRALSNSTPINSGETARSWSYEIKQTRRGTIITWNNSHIVDGIPIAILIQYGHGTRNGGYVEGIDYINPTLKPIFEKIKNELLREVNS